MELAYTQFLVLLLRWDLRQSISRISYLVFTQSSNSYYTSVTKCAVSLWPIFAEVYILSLRSIITVMIPDQITTKILEKVYKRIFCRDFDNSINVFLCGANPDKAESLRNLIHKRIKDYAKFNIVFPESILGNLLFKTQYNLLTLEKELAEDVDAIVLPLEGYGTMAELGAFASFPELTKKIIVVNKDAHKRERSFINMGPIGLIRSKNKKNIIYYDDNSRDEMLDNVYKRLLYFTRQEAKKDIKNLFSLSRFLLYVIAIFQPIRKKEIETYLENWNVGIPEHYVDPGLEILCNKKNIKIDYLQDKVIYILTSEGHHYVYDNLLRQLGSVKEVCKIRSEVLNFQNRSAETFDMNREREKLLEVS